MEEVWALLTNPWVERLTILYADSLYSLQTLLIVKLQTG